MSDICLKQGQGMRGRAAPPHTRIYRVPPRASNYIVGGGKLLIISGPRS